jgi:adenylate cyclase
MEENRTIAYLAAGVSGLDEPFQLTPDRVCRIGRNADNNIVIDHHLISRNHAAIQGSAEGFMICDLGSRNGTLLNGRRVQGTQLLRNGDRIGIGVSEFTFLETGPSGIHGSQCHTFQSTNVDFAPGFVTVLVVDIRDSTLLARQLHSDKLSQVVGTLFREAGKKLHRRGTWSQKYIGDAVMAVWLHNAVDMPVGGNMLSVIDGLLDIVEIAGGLQDRLELGMPIRIGAGVNSGWASIGNLGSHVAADFTAIGETVHKAFRLESATKAAGYDLLASHDTLDILRKAGCFGDVFNPCSVTLKGYDQPIEACGAMFAQLKKGRP